MIDGNYGGGALVCYPRHVSVPGESHKLQIAGRTGSRTVRGNVSGALQ